MKRIFLLALIVSFCVPQPASSQRKKNKKGKAQPEQKAPTTKKNKNGIKPYNEVITKDAVTDNGLFKVHKVGDNYYYEIPNNYLEKDMLLVSRIAKIPNGLGGGYVNAGSKTNEQVVHWQRFQNKILLKIKSYSSVANDSLPINVSVKANNYEPTLYAFDVKAFSRDSSAVVVDVTKFYTTDVKAISGLPTRFRTTYKVKNLDASRSFLNRISSYPKNIEVIQDLTYNAGNPP